MTGGGWGTSEWKACRGKRPWKSYRRAKLALARSRRDFHEDDLEIYACRWCGHFHIGHVLPTRRAPVAWAGQGE